mmetsp:Transcript_12996/g.36595  ORF Transcript_12996/g.36595 Transcript_12996/m.36595 type:complete len:224 (+) Transcript_12996:1298-1969(+)
MRVTSVSCSVQLEGGDPDVFCSMVALKLLLSELGHFVHLTHCCSGSLWTSLRNSLSLLEAEKRLRDSTKRIKSLNSSSDCFWALLSLSLVTSTSQRAMKVRWGMTSSGKSPSLPPSAVKNSRSLSRLTASVIFSLTSTAMLLTLLSASARSLSSSSCEVSRPATASCSERTRRGYLQMRWTGLMSRLWSEVCLFSARFSRSETKLSNAEFALRQATSRSRAWL